MIRLAPGTGKAEGQRGNPERLGDERERRKEKVLERQEQKGWEGGSRVLPLPQTGFPCQGWALTSVWQSSLHPSPVGLPQVLNLLLQESFPFQPGRCEVYVLVPTMLSLLPPL